MRYFDAFSGIGGFSLGIQQAYESLPKTKGQEQGRMERNGSDANDKQKFIGTQPVCVGYSEIDKYAVQIYERHFNHKNFGDITKINATELPDFDLLVGGFPCQAFSIAGKRKGFDDTRGTLFFDLARILKEKRPRYFLFENVKGLLSHDAGNTFKIIIATITELGYDCQWQVLNSKNFGVPQNRERVFIVGHLRGERRPEVFPITGSNEEDTRNVGEDISYALDANYHKGTNTLEKGRRQMIEITKGKSQGNRVYDPKGVSTTIASQAGGQGAKTGLYAVPLKFLERNQKNYQSEYSFTLDSAQTGGIMKDSKIRRLTPIECARLQGFPDDWHLEVSDTQAYKCYGNAVTVDVVRKIIKRML